MGAKPHFGQGSERGLEYDTLSGRYTELVEKDVLLPLCHGMASYDQSGFAL